MTQTKKAYAAAILYTSIIGFSFMFVKLTLTITGPLDTLAHRFTISFLTASIPVLFGFIKLNVTLKNMLSILPVAIFYPALFFTFQAFGLVYTSSSEAGIIQATIPIFTMVCASYFLKERTTIWQKISLLLSVSGVIYIFAMKGLGSHITSFTGVILILLSALSSAGYNVLARKMTKQIRLIDVTYMMTVIGFICFNTLSIGNHIATGTMHLYFKPFTSPLFLASILYLGILSSLLTAFLSNYALSIVEASKMSVFSNMSTLITMFAGVIFLHEEIAYYHIIGAIMIILGVLGTNFLDEKFVSAKKKNVSL
ncbi:Permease of the drug/metabolite transporter (DMT) superfamily [Bacillus sp. 491mf]|uniref:DMT family transporter n=1 Tax=Bacillus TaxID=1386 RepID=UPI0005597EA6|nr:MULTISPECIES: DMT family transporter [unclassified Bacillus (in: firmicutes)]SFC59139.1 Permease of the drug/metabolite transporter (DMT) superfamily [Bacillus sp. 491mf]